MISLLAGLFFLLSCQTPLPTPEHPGALLELDWQTPGWDAREGERLRGQALRMTTQFRIPEGLGGQATLELEGLSYRAEVSLDDRPLPPVDVGLAPTELPLGELEPGWHRLEIQLQAAMELPRVLRGQRHTRWRLTSMPRLRMHGPSHTRALWLHTEGDRVIPAAEVVGAPAGSKVHFRSVLDGELIQDLGEAVVREGRAVGSPQRWRPPRWELGAGAVSLVHLIAELRGPDGALLDLGQARTAARSVQMGEKQLELNGESLSLIAARMNLRGDLPSLLQAVSPAGVNSVELHGIPYAPPSYTQADELGIPLVTVPRCDGQVSGEDHAIVEHFELLKEQNRRWLEALAPHPSSALIALESPGTAERLGRSWGEDGQIVLPVAGSGALKALPQSPWQHQSVKPFPWWILEIPRRQDHGYESMGRALLSALQAGAIGGVVPHPGDIQDQTAWDQRLAPSVQQASSALGAAALQLSTQRASSTLRSTALSPGEFLLVDIPGVGRWGDAADAQGVAELSLWHEGEATVWYRGARYPVTLEAGVWSGFQRSPSIRSFQP